MRGIQERKEEENTVVGPELACAVCKAFFKQELKEVMTFKLARHWRNLPELPHAKELLGAFSMNRSDVLKRLSKNKLTILAGSLSGHCKL